MVATHLLRPLGAGMAIFVSEAANPARVNYYQVYSYNFNIFPSSCGSQEECFLVQVCVHAYCVCMCVCTHTVCCVLSHHLGTLLTPLSYHLLDAALIGRILEESFI